MRQINDQISRELSPENTKLIKKYDREMVSQSIVVATRQKHLRTLLTLSRLLDKDWKEGTKEDLDFHKFVPKSHVLEIQSEPLEM